MPICPVFVVGWQQDCCGEPFAVGDDVEWTLALVDDETAALRDELNTDVEGYVHRFAETETKGAARVLTVADSATLFWASDAPPGTRVRVRGIVMEEHHGAVPANLPLTHGRVRRIFVVTEPYRRGEHAWVPATGPLELREVPSSPPSLAGRTVDERTGDARVETGLLVELDLLAVRT